MYRSFLPSIFYPLPPLQTTDSYGQNTVQYVYPFKITEMYDSSSSQQNMDIINNKPTPPPTNASNITNITTTASPTMQPTESAKSGCDDLNIVIETGKSYFSLLVCGLLCEGVALLLMIAPTCHLVSIKTRRLLKQIVIGLNTLSFMLLLMAFAIWFAYFSTNINQVIEQESNTEFSVCILGTPALGESIAYLLSGWILIGFATMGACYCSNRPKGWYRFLRKKRNFSGRESNNFNNHHGGINGLHDGINGLNINGTIQEESTSDIDSENEDDPNNDYNQMHDDEDDDSSGTDETDDSQENQRLDTLMHRTPSNNSSDYTADGSSFGNVVMKGDAYPVTYSPLQ